MSAVSYGAVGDGVTDDTVALQRALDATAAGTALLIPAGRTFRHTDVLVVRRAGITVTGGGSLLATNESRSSVWIDADNVTLENITLAARGVSRRWSAWEQAKLRLKGHTGVTVRKVLIDGSAASGIFVDSRATSFLLDQVVVQDTQADGIHLTAGANNGRVLSPVVRRSGDDGVAVVSYAADGVVCSDILVQSPTVEGTTWGRGISVVGGSRITYRDVRVTGSNAAAVYIAEEGAPWYTFSVNDVTVDGGTLTDSNTNAAVDHGAILVYNGYNTAMNRISIANLTVRNTRPSASRQAGILSDGASIGSTTLTNIGFTGGPSTLFATNLPAPTTNTVSNLYRF